MPLSNIKKEDPIIKAMIDCKTCSYAGSPDQAKSLALPPPPDPTLGVLSMGSNNDKSLAAHTTVLADTGAPIEASLCPYLIGGLLLGGLGLLGLWWRAKERANQSISHLYLCNRAAFSIRAEHRRMEDELLERRYDDAGETLQRIHKDLRLMQQSHKGFKRLSRPSFFASSQWKGFHGQILEYIEKDLSDLEALADLLRGKYGDVLESRLQTRLEIVADTEKTAEGVISLDEHRPQPPTDSAK